FARLVLRLGERPRCIEQSAARFGNAPCEQSARGRRCNEQVDTGAACRAAEDRDVRGVTAEVRDVLLHPLQGGDLVGQEVVPDRLMLLGESRVSKEPEAAETVVE